MKIFSLCLALGIFLLPSLASAQSFEAIDACLNFRREIQALEPEVQSLNGLFQGAPEKLESYQEQLYLGVQTMTKIANLLASASERYEDDCRAALAESPSKAAFVDYYGDWLFEPVLAGRGFLGRLREQAARFQEAAELQRIQESLEQFNSELMKLVPKCEADLANSKELAHCKSLGLRLNQLLQ